MLTGLLPNLAAATPIPVPHSTQYKPMQHMPIHTWVGISGLSMYSGRRRATLLVPWVYTTPQRLKKEGWDDMALPKQQP